MSDTQWPVYEVFHQSKRGEPHVHVGAVHAPDPEMALMLARDQFARRLDCVSLWVVRADCITATSYDDAAAWFEPATDKSYREAAGFRLGDMLRKSGGERDG
ncbi:MAG TPA: 1,2-phenylacetyl-CoA epoxidase subunit PaaB [Anaerolineae bacterium]|nr:1,2-phenylacetyl-CoA epoxidase subunit PaaB [Anaerolineae bacterium]